MRILVVGGTGFLGGAVAKAGLAAGHQVTVMTRSGRNVAAGATPLIADRHALPDMRGQFDAVIDTCGYAPDMVGDLADAAGPVQYVFVSSISVYADMSIPGTTETADAPQATANQLGLADAVPPQQRGTAGPYGAAYGPLKRSCEDVAVARFGDNASLIRLGLIVGPRDYTDRFTWWVRRCDKGGALPVPGPPERILQIIDVRDAATFLVGLLGTTKGGVFNVTGKPISLDAMLAAIVAETKTAVDIRYLPLSQFTDAGLEPWTDLPLILPDKPSVAHMLNVSIARACDAGLGFRNLGETIRDTLSWDRTRRDTSLKCGMSLDSESALRR